MADEMMGPVIARHVLTLTPDYVADWGFWEAIRELLQNAIDQNQANPQSDVIFRYDEPGERLTVGCTMGHLSPRTLLLGHTTKALNPNAIGNFGEGFKLALLALTRKQYRVTIYNGPEVWVVGFDWSDEYADHLLTVTRHRATDCQTPEVDGDPVEGGVLFDIVDVSAKDFGDVTERYLPEVPLNSILDADHLRRKVFVGGLFVCEVDELEFGYNFAPNRIELDRDRGMVRTFDVAWEASRIWSKSGDDEAVYKGIASGSLDTSYLSHMPDTQNARIVERYLAETPDAIPVSSDWEATKLQEAGNKVRRVPPMLKDIVRRAHKFVHNRSGKPSERLERFRTEFAGQLSDDGRRELDAIVEQSLKWVGPGGCVEVVHGVCV